MRVKHFIMSQNLSFKAQTVSYRQTTELNFTLLMQDLRNNDHGHSEAFATAQYYVRKNYIPILWCRKIDGSQSRFPWYLLTPNLNCGKHNARSKHVEPHLRYSYASRSTSRSSLRRHDVLVHGSFLCQALSAEWNSLSVCAIQ